MCPCAFACDLQSLKGVGGNIGLMHALQPCQQRPPRNTDALLCMLAVILEEAA